MRIRYITTEMGGHIVMKKGGILNSELMKAITNARHHDVIVICDVGMPVPDGCNYIDLALVRGIPSLVQVLKAVLNEMVAERYEIFDLMPQYNPDMYQTLQDMMPNIPGGLISQEDIIAHMKTAKAVIRTAEFGSCCNMVLHSASGLDGPAARYNVSYETI